jgi:hypothetical protein
VSRRVVPAIDDDLENLNRSDLQEDRTFFELEYRIESEADWNLGHTGPLTIYRGKPSKSSVQKGIEIIRQDLEWELDGEELKFRVVKKNIRVDRKVIAEF